MSFVRLQQQIFAPPPHGRPMLPHCSTTRGWSVHLGPILCALLLRTMCYIQFSYTKFNLFHNQTEAYLECAKGVPPPKKTPVVCGAGHVAPIIPPEIERGIYIT